MVRSMTVEPARVPMPTAICSRQASAREGSDTSFSAGGATGYLLLGLLPVSQPRNDDDEGVRHSSEDGKDQTC